MTFDISSFTLHIIGMLLMMIIVVVRSLMDTRVKDAQELEAFRREFSE